MSLMSDSHPSCPCLKDLCYKIRLTSIIHESLSISTLLSQAHLQRPVVIEGSPPGYRDQTVVTCEEPHFNSAATNTFCSSTGLLTGLQSPKKPSGPVLSHHTGPLSGKDWFPPHPWLSPALLSHCDSVPAILARTSC